MNGTLDGKTVTTNPGLVPECLFLQLLDSWLLCPESPHDRNMFYNPETKRTFAL